MGFKLVDLFTKGAKELVDSVGNAIDKNITSKEEKLTLRNELSETLISYQESLDDELTERLMIDTNSDSWLTKNVRPLSLIYTTGLVTALALGDGNIGKFTVESAYITLFQTLLVMQYAFYFGSRGIEKIMEKVNIIKERKKK